MLNSLLNRFARKREEPRPAATVPEGQRIYAIGDIHGRLDLFRSMIERIERDDVIAGKADSLVILLGDLVDRGPESRGVLDAAYEWMKQRDVRILMGNHEEMFVKSITEQDVLRHFLKHGGRETVLSYGMDSETYRTARLEEVQQFLQANVPQEHLDFIGTFEDQIIVGDYLFVHAGIMPDTSLEDQKTRDLRWIREPFLSHSQPHTHVVVHGHSISPGPDDRGNRIGIDTGAYDSGCLTAVALEGQSRRFLEVWADKQEVAA